MYEIDEIIKEIQALQIQFIDDQEEKPLLERIRFAYRKEVLERLSEILLDDTNTENFPIILEDFLSLNWKLVCNSMLSYTAAPESDMTHLLVHIAEWLSQETQGSQKRPAISFLMPGVAIESIHNDYSDLSEYKLESLLKTHILSDDKQYLIPVSLIRQHETPHDFFSKNAKLQHPYYDYERSSNADVSPEEYQRLLSHSEATKSLEAAARDYEAAGAQSQQNFLAQLEKLSHALYMNSVVGMGEEEIAGEQAYSAISAFRDYYDRLPKGVNIPQEVFDEIEKFFKLGGDKETYAGGVENLDTCINTRRKELDKLIKEYRTELAEITLDAEKEGEFLNKLHEKFVEQRELLLKSFQDEQYVGHENHGLTLSLLEHFSINFRITSRGLAQVFAGLSEEDMQMIAKQHPIAKDFVSQFESLDDIAGFLYDLRDPALKTLLPLLEPDFDEKFRRIDKLFLFFTGEKLKIFCEHYLKTALDFGKLSLKFQQLQLTSQERQDIFAVIFEAMKDNLRNLIKNAGDFRAMAGLLSSEHRSLLFEEMKDDLKIENSVDLELVLAALAPLLEAQKKVLNDAIEKGILKRGVDFRKAFYTVIPEVRPIVFEALKDNLKDIIKDVTDLSHILARLTPEECEVILNMEGNILDMIKSKNDFNTVFSQPSDCLPIVLNAMQERGLDFIKDVDDFCSLRQRVPGILFDVMKKQLSDLIRNSFDLKRVLQKLSSDQGKILCELMKDKLPEIIQKVADFRTLFNENKNIFDLMKDKLPDIIQEPSDLKEMFFILTPQQCEIFCKLMKSKLSAIIKNPEDIEAAVSNLSHAKSKYFHEVVRDELPEILQNTHRFGR